MLTMTGLPESEESCPLSRTLSANEEVTLSLDCIPVQKGLKIHLPRICPMKWLMADCETNWWNQQILSGKKKKNDILATQV